MKSHTEIFRLKTTKELEFFNITEGIREIIKKSGIKEGFVNSVEFVLVEKVELDRLEKSLIETARLIQKL